MNLRFFILLLTVCIMGVTPLQAQKAVLKSFTAAKFVQPAKILSESEFHLLSSNLYAIDQTRKALIKNPGWAFTPEFNASRNHLKNLGLPLPQVPAANATSVERTRFLQQTVQTLEQERKALGQLLDQKTSSPTPASRIKWDRRTAALARAKNASDQYDILDSETPELHWGTPGLDEVWVIPMPEPDHAGLTEAALNGRDVIDRIVDTKANTLPKLLDAILYDPDILPATKTEMMMTVANASQGLSFSFVQEYMGAFREIPQLLLDPEGTPFQTDNAALDYAERVQIALVKKLQQKGFWTGEDFEHFSEVSAFFPTDRANLILGAVTYLEPSAALYLLEHPQDLAGVKKIAQTVQATRAEKDALWPNGTMTYKIPFSLIAEQLKKNRLTVLETQHERLEKLLGKLMAREDFLDVRAPYLLKQAEKKVSPADTEHQLWQAATQASFAAQLERLNRIKTQVLDRLGELEAEIELLK